MRFMIFILIILYHVPSFAFEKQDCNIMKYEKDNITFGFKAGGLFWGIGPEVTFGSISGVEWRIICNIWLRSIKNYVPDIILAEFLK